MLDLYLLLRVGDAVLVNLPRQPQYTLLGHLLTRLPTRWRTGLLLIHVECVLEVVEVEGFVG